MAKKKVIHLRHHPWLPPLLGLSAFAVILLAMPYATKYLNKPDAGSAVTPGDGPVTQGFKAFWTEGRARLSDAPRCHRYAVWADEIAPEVQFTESARRESLTALLADAKAKGCLRT
jgi:hypothetical protein